jgi:hypothetical protein
MTHEVSFEQNFRLHLGAVCGQTRPLAQSSGKIP